MPRLEVHVVTPEREVWTGEATIVVARGVDGDVGILAGHAPLLIQLAIGPLFVTTTENERVAAAIDGGFLHVVSAGDESRVDVLAEHADLEQEIDVEKERERQADAERRIQANDDAEAITELAKATVRLGLRG
ncbi:MAG: F0F1 ATP synthase subunit epsilon [Actinomycetota bacterium]